MAFKDLREWIDHLESEEELRRVKAEVNWDREMGSIIRKVCDKLGPALLFENIKDHKDTPCKKFFTNGLGSFARVAMALGLPKNTHPSVLTRTFKERFQKPIEPVIVKDGPVKEVILKGEDIDLYKFPVPKYRPLDGGRYINTSCAVITQDPDTGEINAGTYRGMIADKNTIPVLLATTQHWGNHYAKYRDRGEKMPVAVVYGWDPVLFMVSAIPVPPGVEYELAGALREKPVELIKCETSDLLVPAWAEIVVEGRIDPDPTSYVMEGPFGEYTGYFGGLRSPKPAIRVECITHRKDPILRGCLVGSSPGRREESANFVAPGYCAAAWIFLESVGVPGILDVWTTPIVDSTNLRVKIKKIYRGHAKQVANALWGAGVANYAGKHVIVVDDDIDIHSDEAIDWAIAYRVNAAMDDIVFFPGTFGSMLDPSVPLLMRDIVKYGQGKWCRVLIDATKNWELERQEQFGGEIYPPLATDIHPQDEELVNRRWKEYGID